MKRTNKAFIIFLMTGYTLILIFVAVVGVKVYQGIQIEQNLDNEFSEIEYLINNKGLSDNNIDIKLNSYISSGDYLEVEMAIKGYLKDLLEECRRLEDVYTNTQLNNVLYLYNFDADAPYFNSSKSIIDTAKVELQSIKESLLKMFSEDTIMSYISPYDLDGYYEDYYKSMMFDHELMNENKESIEDNIDYSLTMLNAYQEYFTFLSDNASYWTMDEEYIYFDTDELTDEYNRLLDIIMNMDFSGDIESFI